MPSAALGFVWFLVFFCLIWLFFPDLASFTTWYIETFAVKIWTPSLFPFLHFPCSPACVCTVTPICSQIQPRSSHHPGRVKPRKQHSALPGKSQLIFELLLFLIPFQIYEVTHLSNCYCNTDNHGISKRSVWKF